MPRFDPSTQNTDGANDDRDGGLPPGEYLLAITWFERREGQRTGKDYLRCKYKVIHGQRKNSVFFTALGIDIDNPNIAGRLGVFCGCIGVTEEFELANDVDCKRAFVGKPFKAKISRKTKNGYINNDISQYITQVEDAEADAMRLWARDFSDGATEEGGWGNDSDGPPGSSDPGPPSGGGGGFGDDDVPF